MQPLIFLNTPLLLPIREEPMGIFDQDFQVLQPRSTAPEAATRERVLKFEETPLICHEADADSTWKGSNRHGMHGNWKLS